ncbi:KRAB [Mytilus coruscus]|uniref:KRAB n=1 Tax=Mytilus coruscus TaxID=42192 RepID=A0A6J8C8Y9_MYTCO|nr:KRAB [Mytilus coruscus]
MKSEDVCTETNEISCNGTSATSVIASLDLTSGPLMKDRLVSCHDIAETNYICKVCGNEWSSNADLEEHILTHSGNLCICKVCGNEWSSNADLEEHILTHSGNHDIGISCICKVCGNEWSSSADLEEHILTHSGSHDIGISCICKGSHDIGCVKCVVRSGVAMQIWRNIS